MSDAKKTVGTFRSSDSSKNVFGSYLELCDLISSEFSMQDMSFNVNGTQRRDDFANEKIVFYASTGLIPNATFEYIQVVALCVSDENYAEMENCMKSCHNFLVNFRGMEEVEL